MFKKCWENFKIIRNFKRFSFFTKTIVKHRNRNYNFYDVLGLDRKCTDEEILDAFLRLSKQYHPDVNNDVGAEEKFKSITMAYEALSNQMNRDLYDAYMDIDPYSTDQIREEDEKEFIKNSYNQYQEYKDRRSNKEFRNQENTNEENDNDNFYRDENFSKDFESFFSSHSKTPKQQDIYIKLEVSLLDVFNGSEKIVNFKRIEKCGSCFGYKTASGQRPSKCFNCEGSGEVTINYIKKKCSQCNGEGYVIKYPCLYVVYLLRKCSGRGLVENDSSEIFLLPKGIICGTNIRINQKGHASLSQNNLNSDLLVNIKIKESNEFKRSNNDLIATKEITLIQAICGDNNVKVDSIDGPCWIKIPPGSQNNQKIIVKHKGLPQLGNNEIRGNMIVTLKIIIPNPSDYNLETKEKLKQILKKIAEN